MRLLELGIAGRWDIYGVRLRKNEIYLKPVIPPLEQFTKQAGVLSRLFSQESA
jgi:hypothetical protein